MSSFSPVLVVIVTQVLFTASDFLARANLKEEALSTATFTTRWFALYFLLRQFAMLGQLYVLSNVQLGKTMGLFSLFSLVLANVIGLLYLGDVLSRRDYIAVAIGAVARFLFWHCQADHKRACSLSIA